MNNHLQIFNFGNNRIRVYEDPEGNPWFIAKDICTVLELQNASQACGRLEKDDICSTYIVDSIGKGQEVLAVNEYGLYDLILASRKKEATAFKHWITHEVLPQIRGTGSYNAKPQTQEELLLMYAKTFVEHKKAIQETSSKVARLETQAEESAKELATLPSAKNGYHGVSTRKLIQKLVNEYAIATSLGYQEIYRLIYGEFESTFRVRLSQRKANFLAKGIKKSKLDIIEFDLRRIEDLYALAKTRLAVN